MDVKTATLRLLLPQNQMYLFFPLLQKGVPVSAKVGCDIQSLLCDQFGLMPDFLTDRISTIFLNGKPVDEVKTAIVNHGATLALSAAMPGLVGATFRKAGCLASFRGTITHHGSGERGGDCRDGTIILKLFNLLLKEIGPVILERGILMEGSDLRHLIETFQRGPGPLTNWISKEGCDLTAEQLSGVKWVVPDMTYCLKVTWVS
jgi:hypothetical protein